MYQNIYVDRKEHLIYIWDDSSGLTKLPQKSFSYAWVPDKNGTHLTMSGKRVSKKFNPYMIVGEKYESDVPIETRVLTDLYLNDDTPSTGHTVLYFDIETDSSKGFPDTKTVDKAITDISAYDSVSKQYIVFTLDPTGTLDTSEITDAVVIVCESEFQLLMGFLEYYEQIKPTIITGWNSDKFDIIYIYRRLVKICGEENANRLSPIGKVEYSPYSGTYTIAGVSALDYIELYKKFTYTERPNYRLSTIAQFELNDDKIIYEGSLAEFRVNDHIGFIKYNLQDVKLVVGFEQKLKLIELVRGVCHVSHVPYEDFKQSSRFLEGTLLTHLHRQKIVATDKPAGGKEKYAKQKASGEEGFAGAFVRVPKPGVYEWAFSLDLQSLYPSIIMSLNVSPETKMGKIVGWNVQKYLADPDPVYEVVLFDNDGGETSLKMHVGQFKRFLAESKFNVSSNGILYNSDKPGLIPTVLDLWFTERKKYKKLQYEAKLAGDTEKEEFYDRRQHIQKIFLNSLYGTLGLPIFRFYDLDNALSTTASGQDIIQNTAKFINKMYEDRGVAPKTTEYLDAYWELLKSDHKRSKKRRHLPPPEYPDAHDHCVYVDTDSVYYSVVPFLDLYNGHGKSEEEKIEYTAKIAMGIEKCVNEYYNKLATEYFNCPNHRLFIRGESVARRGMWLAKKRYVYKKVYSLEKGEITDEFVAKGVDIVRSTCPPAFKTIMVEVITDILAAEDKSVVDDKLIKFYSNIHNLELKEIARNSAVKVLSKYETAGEPLDAPYKLRTPAHVKAAINYNRMLRHLKLENEYPLMQDNDKIIYVYLVEDNELGFRTMGLVGERDCPQIFEYSKKHLDYDALFEKELQKKLVDFYAATGWGNIPIGPPPKVKKTRGKKIVEEEEDEEDDDT
jgi:DNA polymerase elongation subunit (family B)